MQVPSGRNEQGGSDEKQAELIAALRPEDADQLWLRLVHLKPHIND
jgi:hypothetical protein